MLVEVCLCQEAWA